MFAVKNPTVATPCSSSARDLGVDLLHPVPAARHHVGGTLNGHALDFIGKGAEMARECSPTLLERFPHGLGVDHGVNRTTRGRC